MPEEAAPTFEQSLTALLNMHGMDSMTGIPDSKLAMFIRDFLVFTAWVPAERERTTRDVVYDDNTMAKVHEALRRAGLSLNGTENAVNLMQNAGIVFRERETDPSDDPNSPAAKLASLHHPRNNPDYEPKVTDQDRAEIAGRIQDGTPPLVATSDVLARKLEEAGIERAPEGTDPSAWTDEDDAVFEAHSEGMDCGRRPCAQCEGLDKGCGIGPDGKCDCDTPTDPVPDDAGNYGPGQPRDPRDVPPGY